MTAQTHGSTPVVRKSKKNCTVYLVRHGETAWTISGQHTGATDLSLTEKGLAQSARLGTSLRAIRFSHAFVSPLLRAKQTFEAANLGIPATVDPDLLEWKYGRFEGLTPDQAHAIQPGWDVFRDGSPGGESAEAVSARAERVIARLRALSGNIAVFSHGHFLRSLGARWIDVPISHGRRLSLGTASLSILGFEHGLRDRPAIVRWNTQA